SCFLRGVLEYTTAIHGIIRLFLIQGAKIEIISEVFEYNRLKYSYLKETVKPAHANRRRRHPGRTNEPPESLHLIDLSIIFVTGKKKRKDEKTRTL
ncbi:hypothetical protein, partial [Phocaeicola sartorii]|uniref:hypothetical protein n=1 Tax=Phocaeicola sartorii TaxID=671267 RepID=UPI00258315E1